MGEINYDIAAIVVLLFNIVLFFSRRRLNILQSAVFLALLLATLGAASADAATVLFYVNTDIHSPATQYAVNTLYYLFQNTIAPLFCVFLLVVDNSWYGFSIKRKTALLLPWFAAIATILSNPWTRFVFSFTDAMEYRRNDGLVFLYLISLMYAVISLVSLGRTRKKLSGRTVLALLLFLPFTLGAFIIQFFNPQLLIINFGISLSELIILLSINDFDVFIDGQTGLFNRAGLALYLENIDLTKAKASVYLVHIDNKQFLGYSVKPEEAIALEKRMIDEIFNAPCRKKFIARFDFGEYALICRHRDPEEITENKERMRRCFSRPFIVGEKRYPLHARLCHISVPEDASNGRIVFQAHRSLSVSDWSYPLDAWLGLSEISLAKRQISVSEATKDALENFGLTVHFQPIVSAETGSIVAAEALVRLTSKTLGPIGPGEFIPVAERSGLIHAIGDFVLDRSCAFLSAIRAEGLPLRYLDINLSPVQFAQFNLADRIYAAARNYGLKGQDLCFEITETAAALSPLAMMRTTEELQAKGFSVAIDDFGVGNSNIVNLLQIPFASIKLDRSLVIASSESDAGRVELSSFVSIFKRIGVAVVAEGVETAEQLEFLKTIGVDHIQGYYFSKPLSAGDFKDWCRGKRA